MQVCENQYALALVLEAIGLVFLLHRFDFKPTQKRGVVNNDVHFIITVISNLVFFDQLRYFIEKKTGGKKQKEEKREKKKQTNKRPEEKTKGRKSKKEVEFLVQSMHESWIGKYTFSCSSS